VSALSPQALNNMNRQIRTKEDLTNSLFENLDTKLVKPYDITCFVNLFNETDFRDACNILLRFQA
jgi:hypothetical protein